MRLVKKNFRWLSTIMIIILVLLLIGVLMNFYHQPVKVDSTISEEINSPNQNIMPIIKAEQKSGEVVKFSGESQSGETENNEIVIVQPQETKQITSVTETSAPTGSQVIISSEDTMTNKQKREILTELDNTLMELLDVVDKVQVIDETRLLSNESEVQE